MPLSGAFITSSMEAVAFWRRLSGVISESCARTGAATAIARDRTETMARMLRDEFVIVGIGAPWSCARLSTDRKRVSPQSSQSSRRFMLDECRRRRDRWFCVVLVGAREGEREEKDNAEARKGAEFTQRRRGSLGSETGYRLRGELRAAFGDLIEVVGRDVLKGLVGARRPDD